MNPEGLQRRLLHDFPRNLQTFERHLPIVRILPVVRIDQGRARRVGRGEPDGTARARVQIGGIECDPGILEPRDAGLDARTEAEMELDVGRSRLRIGTSAESSSAMCSKTLGPGAWAVNR